MPPDKPNPAAKPPASVEALTLINRERLADAREALSILREDAADTRDNVLSAREDVVMARESEAVTREAHASSREHDIHLEEATQLATEEQIARLQQANERLVIATIEAHQLTEQIQAAKIELNHLAHHDPVTDLPNRTRLNDRLTQAISMALREGRKFAVMFLDLDRFKHINDSLGHAVGDQLLRSVAQRLVGCVRQSDTVSRQGGDEFVLLLPNVEDAEAVAQSAQKIREAVELPHQLGQHSLHVSASIGISLYPDHGQDADTLICNADTAMYHAKANGRSQYAFFETDMNVRAVQQLATEIGLRQALIRREFVLHYQPKVNLTSGAIVGIEALLRWQHPERGLLAPAQFVGIAEDCGLILPIGRWVLRAACVQARAWQDAGLPPLTIAVNTSAIEFRARDFVENLTRTLTETRLDACRLELELTESILMRDAESSTSVLNALAAMGVKLAIDDFGTGYSSLSYLRQFPVCTLKIDQSFVSDVTRNPDDAAIVSAIIGMGKSLKQRVIAEGVETAAQVAFLQAQHCDEAQGFYFGHPITAQAITQLMQSGTQTSFTA